MASRRRCLCKSTMILASLSTKILDKVWCLSPLTRVLKLSRRSRASALMPRWSNQSRLRATTVTNRSTFLLLWLPLKVPIETSTCLSTRMQWTSRSRTRWWTSTFLRIRSPAVLNPLPWKGRLWNPLAPGGRRTRRTARSLWYPHWATKILTRSPILWGALGDNALTPAPRALHSKIQSKKAKNLRWQWPMFWSS